MSFWPFWRRRSLPEPFVLAPARQSNGKFENPIPTTVGGFELTWKLLPLYLRNREERFPRRPLGPFRTDASVYNTAPKSGLRITWMGHSSSLVEMDGFRILIDPVWDPRASPVAWAGPKRFYAAPLELEQLPELDVVLLSHDHYDHLGKQTVRRLALMKAVRRSRWVTSLGVGKLLQKFGVAGAQINELNWTETALIRNDSGNELSITAAPARHFSGRGLTDRFTSLWSSFALRTSGHSVYFGADTGWWGGFEAIGATYGPFDVTMLEIGAYNELWKSIHLGPRAAINAFLELSKGTSDPGLFMPIHWGLFDLGLHAWRQPIEETVALAAQKGVRLWALHPGQPTEVFAGQGILSDWWKEG